MNTPLLVIDLGTSSARLSIIDAAGAMVHQRRINTEPVRETTSGSSHVHWDGAELAGKIISVARELLSANPVSDVAITNQRTSCLIWERDTSTVLGPVLSWSDGRTLGLDRQLRREDSAHQAGYSATKWRWLLDEADPERTKTSAGEVCAGTLDSWLAWVLSDGQIHATDFTNAAHTGMLNLRTLSWDEDVATRIGVPVDVLPKLVESTGAHGRATALPGAPMIRVLIGDRQASLFGQSCLSRGAGSITLGTVGAIDLMVGTVLPEVPGAVGYSTVALRDSGETTYAIESSIQAAGSAISWLQRIGILNAPEEIDDLVDPLRPPGQCIFVSALDGLGAPDWKFDARGAFLGLSGADSREDLVRAVLDGIACAFADVLDLMESKTGVAIATLSVDGGLANSTAMMKILAATTGRELVRPVDVEATTRGATMLAHRALGARTVVDTRTPTTFHPASAHPANREAWRRAVGYVLEERSSRLPPKKPIQ